MSRFEPGDKVDMVNDYGVEFPGKVVVAVEENHVRGTTYYIAPTDTPWFAVSERNLRAAQP